MAFQHLGSQKACDLSWKPNIQQSWGATWLECEKNILGNEYMPKKILYMGSHIWLLCEKKVYVVKNEMELDNEWEAKWLLQQSNLYFALFVQKVVLVKHVVKHVCFQPCHQSGLAMVLGSFLTMAAKWPSWDHNWIILWMLCQLWPL